MLNPNHRESFEGWKPQLDDLSLRETGNRETYYDAIRDELHREMDRAMSSFVYSSWIPGMSGRLRTTRSMSASETAEIRGSGMWRAGSTVCSCSM